MFILPFSFFASSLPSLSPAFGALLFFFVFVDDEPFSDSADCIFVIVLIFIFLARIVVIATGLEAFLALAILVNKLFLIFLLVQHGLPLHEISGAHRVLSDFLVTR
jgi:signal transduction histidine kinase